MEPELFTSDCSAKCWSHNKIWDIIADYSYKQLNNQGAK